MDHTTNKHIPNHIILFILVCIMIKEMEYILIKVIFTILTTLFKITQKYIFCNIFSIPLENNNI